ncbi:dodecin family protein [Terasakiella sp. A23]|uniref:dodecin n=1 Tax=Terasakiella sp. FCG-A23 TaxID=3080561 RepID=UPI00295392FE|nr:dodecin [Terasakiella sp. A23]MDV7339239.1 dodecin family protein [Terasakiella sp. A23]
MSDHVYKKVEIVGSSKTSIEDAIETALAKASASLKHIDWFEVTETRGHVIDGKVGHYQVVMKVGFRLD